MVKNYILILLDWCKAKILLQDRDSHVDFKQGEIWWCGIGLNIGVEIFGKSSDFRRPVLIFKKFSKNSFLAIPLTTKQKDGSWYVPVVYGNKEDSAILNQIRVFDARRLMSRVGTVSDIHFVGIKAAFLHFYSQ